MTLKGKESYSGTEELDGLIEETKSEIELSRQDMIELEEMISFEASLSKNMTLIPSTMDRNIISPLSNITYSTIDNNCINKNETIKTESSHLSELAKQLRVLQANNKYKDSEIERLERQLKIVSDLKGVSVIDMRKTLKLVCKEQASQELKNQIFSLKAQLEQYTIRKVSPRNLSQQSESREMANLQLRAGELEKTEETLRKEIRTLYQRLREQIAKGTACEANEKKLDEKVQRHEEELDQRVNDSIQSEREIKSLSLTKQKLISYLRKLHVDLKVEKGKNESLNSQTKLQKKISKHSLGLFEENVNEILPENHNSLHRDIQHDSIDGEIGNSTINHTKYSEKDQIKNTESRAKKAVCADESLDGTTAKNFRSPPTKPENDFIKRSNETQSSSSIGKFPSRGGLSGELGKLLEGRREICDKTQRSLDDANRLEQKDCNRSENRSQVHIKKFQNNRISGELNNILQCRSKKCIECCESSKEKTKNNELNDEPKAIRKLNKHTSIAKETSNILQGNGPDDRNPLKEDPVYSKYFRMLNMGLPKGAVINSMIRGGVDVSILDLDPEKSLASQIPPTAALTLTTTTDEELVASSGQNVIELENAAGLKINANMVNCLHKPNKMNKNSILAENLNTMLQRRIPQEKKNTMEQESTNASQDRLQESHTFKSNKLGKNKLLVKNLSTILQKRNPQDKPTITEVEKSNVLENKQHRIGKMKKDSSISNMLDNFLQDKFKKSPQDEAHAKEPGNTNSLENKKIHVGKIKRNSNASNTLDTFLQDKFKKSLQNCAKADSSIALNCDKQQHHMFGKLEESQTSRVPSNTIQDKQKLLQQNMPKTTSNQNSTTTIKEENLNEMISEGMESMNSATIFKDAPNKHFRNDDSMLSTNRGVTAIPNHLMAKENAFTLDRSTSLTNPTETSDDIEAKVDAELRKIIKEAQSMAGIKYYREEKNVGEHIPTAFSGRKKPISSFTMYDDESVSFLHKEDNSYTLVGANKPKSIIYNAESPKAIYGNPIKLKDIKYYNDEEKKAPENDKNMCVQSKKGDSIGEEASIVYEKLREQTSKAAALEGTRKALQTDIERQEQNALENENENYQDSLKSDYDHALKNCTRSNQKVCDDELQLAVQKENTQNFEQQILARENESSLHKDQFNSRSELQQEGITDMKQQLSSLYTAFGMLDEECTEQKEEYSELKLVLGEADLRIAQELQTAFENDISPTAATRTVASSMIPKNGKELSESTRKSLNIGETVSTPPSKRSDLEASTPLSFSSPRLPTPGSSRTLISPMIESSSQPHYMEGYLYKFDKKNILKIWKKRYFVLKGSGIDYQLTYSTGPLEKIKGIIPLIMGVSTVTEAKEFPTQHPKFVLALNIDTQSNREGKIYLATNSQETIDQWKVAFKIITENELIQGQQEIDDYELAVQIQMQMQMDD